MIKVCIRKSFLTSAVASLPLPAQDPKGPVQCRKMSNYKRTPVSPHGVQKCILAAVTHPAIATSSACFLHTGAALNHKEGDLVQHQDVEVTPQTKPQSLFLLGWAEQWCVPLVVLEAPKPCRKTLQ